MNKIEAKVLIREAKHSMALLISAMGTSFPAVAHLFIKWPDVVDAYIAEDEKRFHEDIYLLILRPTKILAESYAERAKNKEVIKELHEAVYPIATAARVIETKNHLIRICNMQIHKLRMDTAGLQGLDIPYVEECKHGKADY